MLGASLRGAGWALPADRVPNGRAGRRCAARPDEDAVTLAAEAALAALDGTSEPPAALLFATASPPYEEGGSAQPVAELAGLPAQLFTADLTSSARDGLAAVRLALALCAAGAGPVLAAAAHVRRPGGEADSGDGAVALLIGDGEGPAGLRAGPVHTEELRERWRLPGDTSPREADPSFTGEFGSARVARLVATAAAQPERELVGAPAGSGDRAAGEATNRALLVSAPNSRSASRAERALGGPGDPAVARTGVLGAAHPLLRLLCGLDRAGTSIAAAGGLADAIDFEPGDGAGSLAEHARSAASGGRDADEPVPVPSGEGFDPYASAPRAWRERTADLRLEGARYGDELFYPPPPAPPPGHLEQEPRPQRLARSGRVLTFTRDHVYPGGDLTTMAVVELDDGANFYCQVTMGDEVSNGDRVRLVPRRLHAGGGAVQYFWKATPAGGTR
jgi:uncharacterized OB-fold protein